jgi:cytochrome c peroxidase
MIHWHIWEPRLTDREIQLLAIFMGALTDEAFMPEIPMAVPSGLPIPHGRKFASGNDVGFGAQ